MRRHPSSRFPAHCASGVAITLALAALIACAPATPPETAAPTNEETVAASRRFGLDFERVTLSADGATFLVEPLVYPLPVDPSRTLRDQAVLAPQLRLEPGTQSVHSASHGPFRLELVVTTHAAGGFAELEVRQGGTLVEFRSQEFDLANPEQAKLGPRDTEVGADGKPLPPGDPAQAESVTVKVHDAPVGELLRSIAAMANLALEVAPEVGGTVTLEVEDMPWNEVLDAAGSQAGFRWRVDSGTLLVIPVN